MARVALKTPWTSQPQVVTGLDLSNPLARKIKYASTLGNNVLDLKTGKLGVIGGGAPVKATTKGLARSFASASSQSITLPTNNMVSGYPLTVACWASTVPTAAGQVLYSFNGTNYHAILGYLNATLAVMPSVTQDPSFNRHVPVPAGLNYLVAIFRSTTWDLYVNGVLGVQSNLLSASWAEPAAGNHSIGNRLGGATLRYDDGTISDLCVFEGELSPSEVKSLTDNPWQVYAPIQRVLWIPNGVTAALTGTITASTTEADIVAGGKTIILTLTGDTWIAAGAGSFDLQRQNIINGLTSAQSETLGWNLVPKALQGVSGVVRTSDTVVTITLDAQATYNITATETITATIPSTALTGAVAVVATPTFTVSAVSAATNRQYSFVAG